MIRLIALFLLWPGLSQGAVCEDQTWDNNRYTICTVDPATEKLELFLYGDDGKVLGHFSTINDALSERESRLGFAMNAGMYHDDRAPVGHYIEDGQEIMRVVPNAGPGNFGLLPNGVLCLRDTTAHVFETLRYLDDKPICNFATQSGPMLVIDGRLHPRFLEDGTSKFIRNGVGTTDAGDKVVFAISNNPVNFHTFGRLFRDHLKLPQALYFDGNISRLHAPDLGRSDGGFRLGPIIGTVEPLN